MRHASRSALAQYIHDTFVEEDALLAEMRAKGEALRPGMQVSPAEGTLLSLLAHLVAAQRILEIGTFVGYSTLWLARALPEGGRLITLEYDTQHAALAEAFFARSDVPERIGLRRGAALETLSAMRDETFDLVFIDAMKQEYAQYLDQVEPMVRPGGLIIGDNTLLFGAMLGQPQGNVSPAALAAMQEFNRRLADPSRYRGILLPTEEGLTIAQKIA